MASQRGAKRKATTSPAAIPTSPDLRRSISSASAWTVGSAATDGPRGTPDTWSTVASNGHDREDVAVGSGSGSGSGSPLPLSHAARAQELYDKKSLHDHILLRPDTYVGSVEQEVVPATWVMDADDAPRFTQRDIMLAPALYKIFDEILMNAADNRQNDPDMDRLDVVIDREEGCVTIKNNGNGIPIIHHEKHGKFIPELIFGSFLSGSNFSKHKKKTTGGRNGYGAKLTNVFSTRFILETVDSRAGDHGLNFRQEWQANMTVVGKARIVKRRAPKAKAKKKKGEEEGDGSGAAPARKARKPDYTCVTFYPDWARFGMTGFTDDVVALFRRRVYDVAGTTPPDMKVTLNGARVRVKNFKQYTAMFVPEGEAPPIYARLNDRWEVAVAASPNDVMEHVAFVNNIWTGKGGTHVAAVASTVTAELGKRFKKRKLKTTPHAVRRQLWLFVNALVDNPAFNAQTKEELKTPANKMGGKVPTPLPKAWMDRVAKGPVADAVAAWSFNKEQAEVNKKLSGKGGRRVLRGIPKLDDAAWAGGPKSKDCYLILTEGDSAKTLAKAGRDVVGAEAYGIYPLRGKFLNVREEAQGRIMNNEVIQHLVKILGLQYGKEYTDVSELRYGHVIIMADQDHDGSHIKGLVINFFHHMWPSLLRLRGANGPFLYQLITPVVKVWPKGKTVADARTFFTMNEYEAWKGEVGPAGARRFEFKYYKGLGTSTSAEARVYFSNLESHLLPFVMSGRGGGATKVEEDEDGDGGDVDMGGGDVDDDRIDLAFAKKRANDRKVWIRAVTPQDFADYTGTSVTYAKFVDEELRQYAMTACVRALPSVMDGLKPSQRKVLFGALRRSLRRDIKVAQLSGYVSEHAAYHHGETALNNTIIHMAQPYVWSNNLNLLVPSGQFGTRAEGGKDAASPRYIFTRLTPWTRALFPAPDDAVVPAQTEEGEAIEPAWYAPVLPMLLVNGAMGMGSGFSTFVPAYNPRDLVTAVRALLDGRDPEATEAPLVPWARGFVGTVERETATKFRYTGCYEVAGDGTLLRITELPRNVWCAPYKAFLESFLVSEDEAAAKKEKGKGKGKPHKKKKQGRGPLFSSVDDLCTEHTVRFECRLTMEGEALVHRGEDAVLSTFNLTSTVATTNMHAFSPDGTITKYETPYEILRVFYAERMRMYVARREALLTAMRKKQVVVSAQARFVQEVAEDTINVYRKTRAEVFEIVAERGYPEDPRDTPAEPAGPVEAGGEGEAAEGGGYAYLIFPWTKFTTDEAARLNASAARGAADIAALEAKTAADLWREDLVAVEAALNTADEAEWARAAGVTASGGKKGRGQSRGATKGKGGSKNKERATKRRRRAKK